MMTERKTFSIEDDNYAFLQQVGGDNKSAYINELLGREKRKALEEAILRANEEEANDPEYQRELAEWDVTLNDGLDE